MNLTNENMAALEKISEWEFLGPKVERFEKWLENEFFYYDTGNAEEKRLIKKQIVSAFANLSLPVLNFLKMLGEKVKIYRFWYIFTVAENYHPLLKSAILLKEG